MVGESKAIKDSVLAMDSIERITEIIYTNQKQIGILRTAIWLLSNLTQGVSYDLVKAVSVPIMDSKLTFLDFETIAFNRGALFMPRRSRYRKYTLDFLLFLRGP